MGRPEQYFWSPLRIVIEIFLAAGLRQAPDRDKTFPALYRHDVPNRYLSVSDGILRCFYVQKAVLRNGLRCCLCREDIRLMLSIAQILR